MKKVIIILSVVIGIVSVFALFKTCSKETKAERKILRPYVNPPFDFNSEMQHFKLDAAQGGVFNYGYTNIVVPPNAFLDKMGNIVSGNVTLNYKEMNSPVDILVNGIPMELEENAGQYLESGGMFQMTANKNGESLYVNPDAKISVEMQTPFAGDNYNLYSLDTTNRRWSQTKTNLKVEQVKEEKIVAVESPAIKEPNYDAMAQKAGLVNPVKPKEKNKKLFQFKFKTDFSKYPELNIYNGVQWEFAGKKSSENPANTPWVTTAVWNEMEIVKRKRNGIYKLRLKAGSKEFYTTVKPVFDAADMEYAEYVFNQSYTKYRKFIDKKKEEARQWRLKQEQLDRERAQREKVTELTNRFARAFEVEQFGWTNIDRIYKMEPRSIIASFKSQTGERVSVERVYLLIDSVNSLLTFYKSNEMKISYPKNTTKTMIVIDSLAQAYKIENDVFKEINRGSTSHNFTLSKGMKINSKNDLELALK